MFTARVNDLQSFVVATGHTIPNCKLPVGVEPTSLDYRSRPQPLRQGSKNCELLLILDGSIAAHSKDLFTFKLLSRIRQGSNLRWAFARQINSLLSSTSRPLIHNPYSRNLLSTPYRRLLLSVAGYASIELATSSVVANSTNTPKLWI